MRLFILALLTACSVPYVADTANNSTVTEPATVETFVPAWQVTTDVYVGDGWRVECADAEQIVRIVGGNRLCSFNLATGIIVDGDGDGDCDLIPPVDLVVIEPQ